MKNPKTKMRHKILKIFNSYEYPPSEIDNIQSALGDAYDSIADPEYNSEEVFEHLLDAQDDMQNLKDMLIQHMDILEDLLEELHKKGKKV